MEVLRDVLAALRDIVAVMGSIVEVFSTALNLGVSPADAQMVGGLVLVAFVVRMVFWRASGASSFKPQTVSFPTSKTPWEVVMGDVKGCLTTLFWLAVTLGALLALSGAGRLP